MTTNVLKLACVFVVAAVGSAVSGQVPQSPKPTRDYPIFVDTVAPPSTMSQMVQQSDAVVRARITNAEPKDRYVGGGPQIAVETAYTFDVLETFKPSQKLGSSGVLVQEGGTREDETSVRRIVDPHFPAFTTGAEYLLFLKWNPNLATFYVFGRADGTYRIANGILDTVGQGPLARRHNGRSLADVTREIRMIR